MLTILDLSWARTLSGTLLRQRAPGAFRIRVWQITSWGRAPRGGQPPPESAYVGYPLAQEDISTLLSMIPT